MVVDPLPVLVLMLACTVQSAFGFGLALIAVPLLSTALPLPLVTPLLALLSMSLGGSVAWRARAAVRVGLLWRLLVGAALGVPAGIVLIVVLAAVHDLLGYGGRVRLPSWAIWPFGVVTGVLGGAWNLMGPPLVLFLQWSGLDPSVFRATLHAFAFAINALIVAS